MADKVQRAATNLFRSNGFYTVKTQDALVWGGNQGPGIKVPEEPGRADMVVLRNGSATFVEVKTMQNLVWDFNEWSDLQRAWAELMMWEFGMESYLLLVFVSPEAKRPDVKCSFLDSYLEEKPRMAWLLPAYEFSLWCAHFEETHEVRSIPYHSALSGRTSVKETQDGLLERFGHFGLDRHDNLAFGTSFALQWGQGYFKIPPDHKFMKEFPLVGGEDDQSYEAG